MNPSCVLTGQLDAYLDGDPADSGAARAFEAHAEACPACAAELALAQRVQSALRDLPSEPCPYDVFQGALDRIARESKDRPALPAPARVRRPRWQAAGLGAALAVLAALGLALLRPVSEPVLVEHVASAETDTPAVPLPGAVPPAVEPAVEDDTLAAPSPARPEAPITTRGSAPRPALHAAPRGDLAAAQAAPPPPSEVPAEVTPDEVASAREGVLLAFSLFADANRHATEAVRANVGQQLTHVTDALALIPPR